MGCDIHVCIEYKMKDKWQDGDKYRYDESRDEYWRIPFYSNRSYELFAELTGVRNRDEINPICEPKGFPEDACIRTRNDYKGWDVDAHSASWLTLKELFEHIPITESFSYFRTQFLEEVKGIRYLNEYEILKEIQDKGDNFRIVFWFDN